jgi:hypothetical protein
VASRSEPMLLTRDHEDWLRRYEERLAETRAALQRLQRRLAEQCGSEHRYVDHHDERPPWCDRCRVLDCGLPLADFRYGSGRPRLVVSQRDTPAA